MPSSRPATDSGPRTWPARLQLSPRALEAAAEALIAAGLAERRDRRLFPSQPTRALEALWPLAM